MPSVPMLPVSGGMIDMDEAALNSMGVLSSRRSGNQANPHTLNDTRAEIYPSMHQPNNQATHPRCLWLCSGPVHLSIYKRIYVVANYMSI